MEKEQEKYKACADALDLLVIEMEENEMEKYGIEEKKWNSLVDNLGLHVADIIWAIQTACEYNGLYDAFEDWVRYGNNIVAEENKKNNKYYVIACPLDFNIDGPGMTTFTNCGEEIDSDDYAQLQIIWMMCVLLYGDYGTSPRFGWIDSDKWNNCKDFLYVLIMHMQYREAE